jgi:hypothetical protein
MLRWTCRLRDAFAARGFLSSNEDSLVLSEIKEAEFVVAPNEAFPHEFRWKTFCSCFKLERLHLRIVDVTRVRPVADVAGGSSWASGSAQAMNGQAVTDLRQGNIDILWLSPTVFISSLNFCIPHQVHDYEVGFGGTRCSITQLAAFDQVEFDKPSPLPIDFFRHLAPSELIGTLELNRSSVHPNRFPVGDMMSLLSAFSNASLFILGGLINIDELRVLLAFPFHPRGILSFTKDPFDGSVSLYTLMELLKTAPYLRNLIVPRKFFLYEAPSGGRMFIDVESPALSMTYRYFAAPPAAGLLNDISRIHQAGDKTSFELKVEHLWEGENVALVTSVAQPFLDGSLALENLRIQVADGGDKEGRPEPNVFRQVVQALASVMISCRSKHLCHFSVALCLYISDDDDIEDDDDDVVDYVHYSVQRYVHKIQQWDETIFPQLVLNQWNKKLAKAVDGALLPSAIGAINRGIVYRKTTDHIPYDMKTANAGLIFHHIKTNAVKAGQN